MTCFLQPIAARSRLDSTPAFDTVDHDLLTLCLERQFGLRNVVLQSFSSYLSDRSFRVVLVSNISSVVHLLRQCSVLGPCLFMADFADCVEERQVNFHSFADDTLTYLHCSPGDVHSMVYQLEGCIREVGHCMSADTDYRRSLSGLVPGIT